jgi:hypothetical protein
MSLEPRDPQAIDGDAPDGDARDAVTGPVGNARLVEPAVLGDRDNELERLTPIDEPELPVPDGQV